MLLVAVGRALPAARHREARDRASEESRKIRGEGNPEITAEETVRNLTTIERLLEVAERERSHAA